jgi:Domain of unknown function (DUF4380)
MRVSQLRSLIFLAILLAPASVLAAAPESFAAKIEQTEYQGWKVYRLTNGLISLYIAPQLGGRAIQLELGGQSLFFVNKSLAGKVLPESENNLKSGWANYGGDKVWPAPEGWDNDNQWPSIPYYILDGSTWDAEVMTNNSAEVALRVTSPKDPRSGVQFVRTFHVYAGTTRVKVEELMRNISRRQVRWGIWHLIQNDAADEHDASKPNPELFMYVPLNSHSMFPKGFYNPYGDARHPSYETIDGGRMLRVHYLYRVGKVAADSDAGWYAVVNGQKNTCLVETFKYLSGEKYPDNASVESWNDGPGIISRGPFDQTLPDDPAKTPYFLESEVLSPFATLEPGDEYNFTVQWSPTRAPNPIHDSVWAGAISEPFSASVNGNQATLRGVFGAFMPGTLEATFYSTLGEELSHENLMSVDPREVVRLDKSIAVPAGAYRVSVRLLDAKGGNRGFLGNVILAAR